MNVLRKFEHRELDRDQDLILSLLTNAVPIVVIATTCFVLTYHKLVDEHSSNVESQPQCNQIKIQNLTKRLN